MSDTQRWLNSVSSGGRLLAEAQVWVDGDRNQQEPLDGKIVGGTVTKSYRAAMRSSVTGFEIRNLDLIPSETEDLLAPYGNEIHLRRGFRHADGTDETVGLGVFRILDVEVNALGAIAVSLEDRAARYRDARFEDEYEIADGTNVVTAIEDLVAGIGSAVATQFEETDLTTNQHVAGAGDDRWDLAQKVVAGAGMELFFDGNGELVLQSIPDPTGDPDLYAEEGEALVDLGKNWSRQDSPNVVVVTGEHPKLSTPVRASAEDDDPESPTYIEGPYGRVPRFYSSQFVKTEEQANRVAASQLSRHRGTTQRLEVVDLVDARAEPNDLLQVKRELIGVNETHVIDTVTTPLVGAQQNVGTRAVRVS